MGDLSIGAMAGGGGELTDMMEQRKVDMMCLREAKWRGSEIGGIRGRCKLFCSGADERGGGMGMVVGEELVRGILGLGRVSERLVAMRLEVGGSILNVVSACAPWVDSSMEDRGGYWEDLDGLMEGVSKEERVVLGP